MRVSWQTAFAEHTNPPSPPNTDSRTCMYQLGTTERVEPTWKEQTRSRALISRRPMSPVSQHLIGWRHAERYCFETLAGSGDAPGRVSGAITPLLKFDKFHLAATSSSADLGTPARCKPAGLQLSFVLLALLYLVREAYSHPQSGRKPNKTSRASRLLCPHPISSPLQLV